MTMSVPEVSLLLYVESCAVDRGGLLDAARLNMDDLELLKQWDEEGFVLFGRVDGKDVKSDGLSCWCYWCDLSEEAWKLAAAERRKRGVMRRREGIRRLYRGRPVY